MSALGDYIHLRTENYLKYGTAKKGEQEQPMIDSYNAQKQRNQELLNQIQEPSQSTLAELKRLIANESTQEEAMQIAKNLSSYNQSINDITNQLKEKILQDVPSKFESEDYGIRTVKSNLKTNKNLVNIEEAKKARRRFYDNINTINSNAAAGKPVRQSTLNTLLKNASDFFNYLGIVNSNLEFIKYRDLRNANTIAALKNMMQLVSLSDMNKAALHGTYGEVLVNMVSDNMRVKAGKELESALKQTLQETGGHRTQFSIDENMITPKVQQAYYEKTGNNLYQIRATQDKVDASIIIEDEAIEASIKAYTPKGNFITAHLQDVNLITNLITTEAQFANHWLNLHALNIPNQDMDNELKKYIEYEALVAGNMLKKGTTIADTFIVIDATQGRVFAKSTKDILQNYEDNFILDPMIENIAISNQFASTWEERIANILLSLHQQSISVSYKVALT